MPGFHSLLRSGVLLSIMTASCGGNDQEIKALTPVVALSPDALDFGEVIKDYKSTVALEVINAGRAPLDITDYAFLDPAVTVFEHDGVPISIEPDGRYFINVSCTPTAYNTYANTLSLATNDEDALIVSIPLTCTGRPAPTPDIYLDPDLLDFGAVPDGYSTTLWTILGNSGDGDLVISSTSQTGSGAFVVMTDPDGLTLAPGEESAVIIIYTNNASIGDSGSLHIASNDPDESDKVLTLLAGQPIDFDYPVAVIEADTLAEPLETLSLDGTESYDPNGLPLTYSWTLLEWPQGSSSEISGPTADISSIFLDLAGDYMVQLVVTNEIGVISAPAKHEINAIPTEGLRVEMFWDTGNSDLDLHLTQEGYEFFEQPGDCNYCNPSPSWGPGGGDDDPRLDLDNISGYGPENINIDLPADGNYDISVHYFEDNGGGATTATVRVYLNQAFAYEESEVLERNQMWHVGTIEWDNLTPLVAADEISDPSSADHRSCWD